MDFSPEAHWRDSARPIKFFIFDGSAAFPVVIMIMHISWWTLGISVFLMIFFSMLNRVGFTPLVFGRWLRSILAGPRKLAVPWWMT